MPIRKSYAGKVVQKVSETILDDGTIVTQSMPVCEPTRHVDVHPLEEKEILAHWAIHDVNIKIPPKPTQQDEHEMLINEGVDAVKKARIAWKAAFDAIQPELQAAQDYYQKCLAEWNAHAERAVAANSDPDTYELEKYK